MSASRLSTTSLKVKLHKILQTFRRMRQVFPVLGCGSTWTKTCSHAHFDAGHNRTSKVDLRAPPTKPLAYLFDNNASTSSYVNQACNVDAMELVEWNYEIYQNARNEQLERERRTLESDAV